MNTTIAQEHAGGMSAMYVTAASDLATYEYTSSSEEHAGGMSAMYVTAASDLATYEYTSSLSSAVEEPLHFYERPTGTALPGAASAYVSLFLRLIERFRQVIRESRDELFFDGMNSQMREKLHYIVGKDGIVAVEALRQVLNIPHYMEIEVVEEILRQLGLIRDSKTHEARLNLLTDTLKSERERIRDAASLGLSFLEDSSALTHLLDARRNETVPWLMKNLDLVIEELEQAECRSI